MNLTNKEKAAKMLMEVKSYPLVIFVGKHNKKNRTVRLKFAVDTGEGYRNIHGTVCNLLGSKAYDLGLKAFYGYGNPFTYTSIKTINKEIAKFNNDKNVDLSNYVFNTETVIVKYENYELEEFFENHRFNWDGKDLY